MSDYWLDIGTPQRYWQANDDLLNERIHSFEVERVPVAIASTSNLNADAESANVDSISVVDPSCSLKPGVEIINSVLGANCVIEERAKIENSVVLAGARIGKASEIRNSIIGKSAIIGRNSKVDGATLGDKSSLTDYSIV